MTFPKARLVVSACLFVGWLGFLLFLVLDTNTIILSRPQFLIAQTYAVVELHDGAAGKPDPMVLIDEVIWSADPADEGLVKKQVRIPGVAVCGPDEGYAGPGQYLLPLLKTSRGAYVITPMPKTAHTPEIRIYPWTPGMRSQVEDLIASKK
jgi:hypothetical protein